MLYVQTNRKRQSNLLDGIWNFHKDGERAKRPMAVPGSWNEQYEDLYQFHGVGIYERTFLCPSVRDGETVLLRFGSVTGRTRVLLNGVEVMEHVGAALPFEADIKEYLREGENQLTVISDNSLDPWGLPPAALEGNEGRVGFHNSYPTVTYDFFPYSGIHRSVWLCVVPKLRIEDITVQTKLKGKDGAVVSFKVIFNQKIEGNLEVESDGNRLTLPLSGEKWVEGILEMKKPILWEIGAPHLYKLSLRLKDKNGRQLDTYHQSYGIREITVEKETFFLNGKPVFLKGFGKHEDFPVIGKGFFAACAVKDFSLMKKVGANSFRTSHYPYDEQMLALADEQGFLVISETPMVGLNDRMYKPEILEQAKGLIRELIARDKNHPSVIAWSLANEPTVNTVEGEAFFEKMAETARSCDGSRPITYAAHLEPENNRAARFYDFICLNKYYGWYIEPGQIDATLPQLREELERFHEAFHKGILMTEFGADAVAGIHALPPVMFSEEYQSEMIEKQYRLITSLDYMMGAHIWAFADFRTAQSISRIVDNRKGIFTRTREPKMAAMTVEKLWKGED